MRSELGSGRRRTPGRHGRRRRRSTSRCMPPTQRPSQSACSMRATAKPADSPCRRGPGRCITAMSPGCRLGTRYGLRAYGPWDPGQRPPVQSVQAAGGPLGHDGRPAVPPASAAVRPRWPAPGGHRRADAEGDSRRALRRHRSTTAPGSTGTARSFYELHVRGFTMTHPDIPPAIRGTFAALGHPAMHRPSDPPRRHHGGTDAQRRLGR